LKNASHVRRPHTADLAKASAPNFQGSRVNQTSAACRAFSRLIAVVKTLDVTDFLVDANDLM
jgi:hypothetical protein